MFWSKEVTVAVVEPPVVEPLVEPPVKVNSGFSRMDVTFSDNAELLALATKAKEVLGYTLLEARIASPLLRALIKLDIVPLETERVNAYKKEAEKTTWAGTGSPSGWCLFPLDELSQKNPIIPPFYNQWIAAEAPRYNKAIPEFVIAKAIQIREALPECRMYVDELRYYPDPFLVAIQGDEAYYIEVWDEPKFEGRITK